MHMELHREFRPIGAKEENPEVVQIKLAAGLGEALSWDELLEKSRVVVLAEPGTGKTEEFRAVTERLRSAGKPAFFCRIELLHSLDFKKGLDIGTAKELEEWMAGNQEGYFFLDSVDEARLAKHSAFESALRCFANLIGEHLNRAKVFITCRVSEWRATADLAIFLKHVPHPDKGVMEKQKSVEDDRKICKEVDIEGETHEDKKDDNVFQLLPLNEQQIRIFTEGKGISDINAFINELTRADAIVFAERPQDLLELISFWKKNNHFGRYIDMMEFNIDIKLKEDNIDRAVKRQLSANEAREGAERLAAALTLQKKSTIALPGALIDIERREASIKPEDVFPDWSPQKIQALLDRGIFDEASYGTVQFHHRTVREYLTARWFQRLLDQGKSRRLIDGLFFKSMYGRDVVVPTMRPIVAWLSIWDEHIRARVRAIAPEVLIEYGDPSALPLGFRKSLLMEFAEHNKGRQLTGISFDGMMIRRLADPQLSSTVNALLKEFAVYDDICTLLLVIIWQGRIRDSADAALAYALNEKMNSHRKIWAIRAVAAAGTLQHHQNLVNGLLSDQSTFDLKILRELCENFFPETLSVKQLLEIIKVAEPPREYSSSPLERSLESIADNFFPEEIIKELLKGLHSMLQNQPFIDLRYCKVSRRYAYLLKIAIKFANQCIRKRSSFSFSSIVLDLFQMYLLGYNYPEIYPSMRGEILKPAKAWSEFQLQLFWHVVSAMRDSKEAKGKQLILWWQVSWEINNFWIPRVEDLEYLFEKLINKPCLNDGYVALKAIFQIYVQEKRPRQLRRRLKCMVAGQPELKAKLKELLKPKPSEERKWQQKERKRKQRQEARKKREEKIRRKWQKMFRKKPENAGNIGNAKDGEVFKTAVYLYEHLKEDKRNSLGRTGWESLIDEFGYKAAKNFRDGCISYWREYDPFSYPNWRTKTEIPWARMISLTGLAMEAANGPDWIDHLTCNEARLAAHHSICELNSFPFWFKDLFKGFPKIVDEVIIDELRWEFRKGQTASFYPHVLSALIYSNNDELRNRYKATLVELLSKIDPVNDQVLGHALSIVLGGDLDNDLKQKTKDVATRRLKNSIDEKRKISWLIVLLVLDGDTVFKLMKQWVDSLSTMEERKRLVIKICAALISDGGTGLRFNRAIRDFERIDILSELVPFVYRFVRPEEDVYHEGVFTSNDRDYAERTRSMLLEIIYNTPGRKSYEALINLSKGIDDVYSKERIENLANKRAALDAEFEPWSEKEVAEFLLSVWKEPKTQKDLYELTLIKLYDLKDDIEDGDQSEAVLLKKLTKETEVRTILAKRLREFSFGRYTVESEEELADGARTDIRFNAPQVLAAVPIELKIADNWSVSDLRERLENQLINQYMRKSQYGIFLIVYNGKKRYWKDFLVNKRYNSLNDLIGALKQDVPNLLKKHPNIKGVEIIGIDFTARFKKEKSNTGNIVGHDG